MALGAQFDLGGLSGNFVHLAYFFQGTADINLVLGLEILFDFPQGVLNGLLVNKFTVEQVISNFASERTSN